MAVSILQVDPLDLWMRSKGFIYRGSPYWGNNIDNFMGMNPQHIPKAIILKKISDELPRYATQHIRGLDLIETSPNVLDIKVLKK